MEENKEVSKEVKKQLYPNKRKQLEEDRKTLKDQIQKGQQAANIIQQELQELIQKHIKIQAKLELLDELEVKEDTI